MKATVDRETLRDILTESGRYVSSGVGLPVLGGVLVEAGDGRLTVRATDLETSYTGETTAEVGEPGRVLVNSKLLAKTVAVGADAVTITDEGDRIAVDLGDATVRLRPLAAEDFPALPEPGTGPTGTLDAADLGTLGRVAVATETNESRPVLTGVLLDGADAAATDAYRLHVGRLGSSVGGTALVPGRTVALLAKMKSGQVDVTVEDSQVRFAATVTAGTKKAPRTHRMQVLTKLIEGTFPDFRKLMPDGGESLTVDSVQLAAAVKRIASLVRNNIPVRLSASDGALVIEAFDQDLGEASAQVPVVDLEADWTGFAANPTFLVAAVAAATPSGNVTLRGVDGLKPWTVTAEGSTVSALVMPMRLS